MFHPALGFRSPNDSLFVMPLPVNFWHGTPADSSVDEGRCDQKDEDDHEQEHADLMVEIPAAAQSKQIGGRMLRVDAGDAVIDGYRKQDREHDDDGEKGCRGAGGAPGQRVSRTDEEQLADGKQHAERVPEGHCATETRGERPHDRGVRGFVDPIENGVNKKRDREFVADQKPGGEQTENGYEKQHWIFDEGNRLKESEGPGGSFAGRQHRKRDTIEGMKQRFTFGVLL